MTRILTSSLLRDELVFSTSRAGGPGGQNVNKVETKVTLRFDVTRSLVLTEVEREVIQRVLANHMTKEGFILISAQASRSQLDNKQAVLHKLDNLLSRAFKKRKPRKATKPSRSSKLKRLQSKKVHAEKKRKRGYHGLKDYTD